MTDTGKSDDKQSVFISYNQVDDCASIDELLKSDKISYDEIIYEAVVESKSLQEIDALLSIGKKYTVKRIPFQHILPNAILDLWKLLAYRSHLVHLRNKFIKSNKIQKLPGSDLNAFAEFVYSKKTYKQIYQPTICDMQDEYFEALAVDKNWKARMVLVRGYFSFFSAMIAHVPLSGLKLVKKIWTIVG